MKAELFSTLKQSVEILQNDMIKEEEPVWLGTLWNVDQSLAKMAEKDIEQKNQRIRELEQSNDLRAEIIGNHCDRISKLENVLRSIVTLIEYKDKSDVFYGRQMPHALNQAKKLLAESERRAKQ